MWSTKHLSSEDRLEELGLLNLEKALGRSYSILPIPEGGLAERWGTHILAGPVAIGQGVMALN